MSVYNNNDIVASLYAGQNIRRLVKDGLIIRKPVVVHSRFRIRKRMIARRKGRHMGIGESMYEFCSLFFFYYCSGSLKSVRKI